MLSYSPLAEATWIAHRICSRTAHWLRGGTCRALSSDILSRRQMAEARYVRAHHFSVTRYATRSVPGRHLQPSSVRSTLLHVIVEILYWQQDVAIFTENAMSYTNLKLYHIFTLKDSLKTINLVNAPLLYSYIFGICRPERKLCRSA